MFPRPFNWIIFEYLYRFLFIFLNVEISAISVWRKTFFMRQKYWRNPVQWFQLEKVRPSRQQLALGLCVVMPHLLIKVTTSLILNIKANIFLYQAVSNPFNVVKLDFLKFGAYTAQLRLSTLLRALVVGLNFLFTFSIQVSENPYKSILSLEPTQPATR